MADQLKQDIKAAQKAAMKAGEKDRLLTIRTIMAEIKRVEVDERIDVEDARILVILDKMVKQRRDSIKQYESAGRDDLVVVEQAEMAIIQDFLPQQLSSEEIDQIVSAAISQTGAASVKDMGKVMGIVKPQVQGRADMGAVGGLIKSRLG